MRINFIILCLFTIISDSIVVDILEDEMQIENKIEDNNCESEKQNSSEEKLKTDERFYVIFNNDIKEMRKKSIFNYDFKFNSIRYKEILSPPPDPIKHTLTFS